MATSKEEAMAWVENVQQSIEQAELLTTVEKSLNGAAPEMLTTPFGASESFEFPPTQGW